ncbi:unnamed protein product, partial [Allacma fusca]
MDVPIRSETVEGQRISPTPVGTSSPPSSGDFHRGDATIIDLPFSDAVGEESNILGTSTHQQVAGVFDGAEVER